MWQVTMFMTQATETGSLQKLAPKVRLGLSGGSETVLVADENDRRNVVRAAMNQCGYRVPRADRSRDVVVLAQDERRAIELMLVESLLPKRTATGPFKAEQLTLMTPGVFANR